MLTEEAKKARKAYKRQWARDHPDSVRSSQERYWNKKGAQLYSKKGETEGGKDIGKN